jgi:mRNA interferase MazF
MLLAQAGREDWIVCQITSNPFGENGSLPLTAADFATGSLPHTSYVRPGKVFTAHASLIGPIVGTLTDETFAIVRNSVIAVIEGR